MANTQDAKAPAVKATPAAASAGTVQPIGLDLLGSRFEDVHIRRSPRAARNILQIHTRDIPLDPIATKALKITGENFKVDQGAVLQAIRAKGVSAEIAKVTRNLNQRGMSDARRRVLAATYAHTVKMLLDEGKVDPKKDVLGFTEAVLFSQQHDRPADATGSGSGPQFSPVTQFLQAVVAIVKKNNHLHLKPMEELLLVKSLKRMELPLKPGRLEPRVTAQLDKILEQGPVAALVEEFVARNEIDATRFTPEIKQAMVRYLLDLGVQMTDKAVLDSGGYDEYFALAYGKAITAASGGQDPIDRARVDGGQSSLAQWDFTVETFDDIEEQGIFAENILAAGAIDYVYELGERMGVFSLADAAVLNWASGAIDVVEGPAADKMYRYWKLREERSSPQERAMLYKRVLNKGNANLLSRMVVNEPFPALWHNLFEEVARYIDKTEKLDEGRADDSPVSRSPIYQATKELQYNLTEYCTGMAHMQARELYAQLQEAFDILRDGEVIAHFGGSHRKSMWTVIEQLSKAEFGRAPNIAAIRSLAVDGNRIFQWIAGFDEALVQYEDFFDFLEAAEPYILNMALVGEAFEPLDKEEDDWEDDGWEDDLDDDFDDF